MNIVFILYFLLLFALSYTQRTDLFSPLRVFLLNIIVFWGDIFVNEYNPYVSFYFFTILSFGLVIYILEGKDRNTNSREKLCIPDQKKMWVKLWILTLIPVLAQFYLIMKMGGIAGYIYSIGLRVKEWSGLGIYIVLIRTMPVINLVYYILLVKSRHVGRMEKVFFFFNFVIFVIISLLSGSRSTLLVNFVLMFIVYYYYVKKISVSKFFLVGVVTLFLAMVMGIARNGYSYKDGELKTGLSNENSEKKIEAANFTYGLFPLKIITEQEYLKSYSYGSTYLSALTNVIPRSIWPGKPDTGGVTFTSQYQNIHQGYSNYSTDFLVEGILNFGYVGGTVFAYALLFLIYWAFTSYYKKYRCFHSLRSAIIYYLSYVCFLFLIPTYLHGEFTTVTHTIFINKIAVIIAVVYFVIPSKINYIPAGASDNQIKAG